MRENSKADSLSIRGLFILALIYTLYVARPLIVPLVVAVLLTFLLTPIVRVLGRAHVPRAVASAMVLLVLASGMVYGVSQLAEPTANWVTRAPFTLRRMENKVRAMLRPAEQINKVASEVQQLASNNDPDKPQKVEVQTATPATVVFNWTKSFVGYVALTVVLLYFLLTVEDLVTRLFAAVLPPDDRKKALEITVEASHSVSRYLATIAMINMGLGVATGVAMWLSGMPNPALWGVMAALMPFIPYLGAAVGVAVLTTVSFTTFDSWSQALLPPLLYLALACLEGGFVTPSVLGRRLLLNPVAVLLSLMFWGLLWGIVGAILAVPLLTILKIICDHIKSLAFVSELLSRD